MQSGGQSITLGRQRPSSRAGSGRGSYALYIGIVVLLLISNALTALALYFAPEINTLMREDKSGLLTAYEQRITELRLEVDRLHSRQYARMGDMNLQMHELIQQQEVLAEQHEYVRALTEMAREVGIGDRHPSTDPMITGSVPPLSSAGDVNALAASLLTMQEETRLALVSLSDAATLSANDILTGLRRVGIEPEIATQGVGGPFIPAKGEEDSIIAEANAVADALTRYQSARRALLAAPVQVPVQGAGIVTSNFGNRTDPFLKRPAFHAGIDFRASTGTPVLAAADGVVSIAGTNGGYGKMVEIDHGNGLATRYAHMSQIGVAVGQSVSGGQRLGLAGSTGRSTGPHLHFEVRRDGNAIDPARFIAVGRALSMYL